MKDFNISNARMIVQDYLNSKDIPYAQVIAGFLFFESIITVHGLQSDAAKAELKRLALENKFTLNFN